MFTPDFKSFNFPTLSKVNSPLMQKSEKSSYLFGKLIQQLKDDLYIKDCRGRDSQSFQDQLIKESLSNIYQLSNKQAHESNQVQEYIASPVKVKTPQKSKVLIDVNPIEKKKQLKDLIVVKPIKRQINLPNLVTERSVSRRQITPQNEYFKQKKKRSPTNNDAFRLNNVSVSVQHKTVKEIAPPPPPPQPTIPNIPEMTAKSWIVYDFDEKKVIIGKKYNKKREVASLTKIMNAYVCLKTLQRMMINPRRVARLQVKVSKQASTVIGTSAGLIYGDILSAHDLLYALMLPSGNDAAVVLAQGVGTLLMYEKKNWSVKIPKSTLVDVEYLSSEGEYYNQQEKYHENPVDYFLDEMNYYRLLLELKNSQYDSPHGLANKDNYSSAFDVSKIAKECYDKFALFNDVVNCREYNTKAITREGASRSYVWRNTNKLLEKGFFGIKTGITDHAGPCLAAAYELESSKRIIIVVLNCLSMDHRWDECIRVVEYLNKYRIQQ